MNNSSIEAIKINKNETFHFTPFYVFLCILALLKLHSEYNSSSVVKESSTSSVCINKSHTNKQCQKEHMKHLNHYSQLQQPDEQWKDKTSTTVPRRTTNMINEKLNYGKSGVQVLFKNILLYAILFCKA